MGHTSALDAFLNLHRDQLISSGIPELYWQTLHLKLINQIFDAGQYVQIVKMEYEEERKNYEPIWALQSLSEIDKCQPEHIYLIDHAWTYRIKDAKMNLHQFDSLRTRFSNIFDLDINSYTKQEIVDKIFDNMWKVNNFYSIKNAESTEERLPVWYVMDEIGTAVIHNDSPNCRIIPFVYANEQVTYSLLFPIKKIEEGDILCRDYAEGIVEPIERKAILLPWVPSSFVDISTKPNIPGQDYYLNGHIEESLPIISKTPAKDITKEKYKVYSQYQLIKKHLTDSRFELVTNEEEADILWYIEHFKNFKGLSETLSKYVNQFPFEFVLTVKDLLCMTCRRLKNDGTDDPIWLPTTYNLVTELGNFLSYFQQRNNDGQDNYWIIKPYNLARGLDMHVTNNLDYIMRLPATGPKIVQKYITDPVLFFRTECSGRVKFDLRYVILLNSVSPLTAYVYKKFFLRFANKPFELNNFHDYEKHFTVMNYNENVTLKHMLCEEFKIQWKQQYPKHEWNEVEESVLNMLRAILECAIKEKPPCGIADNPQSRALYAADIMLEWTIDSDIVPKILEINFTPDCKRACDYYPDFYNSIFKLLFLDEESDLFFTL